MTNFSRVVALFALALLAGCESTPPAKADPVDVSGTVTMNGKPVGGVTIEFFPTSAMQAQGFAKLKADGKFSVKLVPGNYTYAFEGSPAALKAIPASYHSNDANHTFEVPAGGSSSLQITVGG